MNDHAKKALINFITIIISLIALGLMYRFFGCPIRRITGFPCPGCGMIHACMRLLGLNLSGALEAHPFVIALPVYIALFINRYNQTRTFNIIALGSFCAILILIYIYRIFFGLV